MTAGVPQRNTLDPVVSPVHQRPTLAALRSTVDIYADNATLSFPSDVTNGFLSILSALQQHLDNLSQWSAANKMVTHAAKTKCLLVTGKRLTNKIVDSLFNFHLGNSNT